MSLSKKMIAGVLLILTLVFAFTLLINVNNMRGYIEQQLASHAQDTATSLGLSLAPHMGNTPDVATLQTMVNAIFDRGYYLSITLINAEQVTLVDKRNPLTLDGIPDWFIRWFPLQPPTSESAISAGWTIAGQLSITSHPGLGYRQLWQSAVQTFWMILGLFVLAGILVALLMLIISKPINAVVMQARQIMRGRFVQVDTLPSTTDLRDFVKAMNLMSAILQKMFDEASAQAEKYRQVAYRDSLTGLANRRAFELQFSALLNAREASAEGYLVIVRLSSLQALNQSHGADTADVYITTVVDALIARTREFGERCSLYRLSGADIGIVLTDFSTDQARQLCEKLDEVFKGLTQADYSHGTAHMGAALFAANKSLSEVLQDADSALAVAASQQSRWQFSAQLDVTQSNQQWREQIAGIIEHKAVSFVLQPIKSPSGERLYQECFARFSLRDQSPLPSGQLIPASERLNYARQIDQLVIEQALPKIAGGNAVVGLNLTNSSVADDKFCAWLLEKLGTYSAASVTANSKKEKDSGTGAKNTATDVCHKLVIEVSEHSLGYCSKNLIALSQALSDMGVRVTLEHFGASMAPFKVIKQIRPAFVKIDRAFVRDIDQQTDNQTFVRSLVSIAHSLNILVIAEAVETAQEANALKSLSVDYLQGYFINQPTHWGD